MCLTGKKSARSHFLVKPWLCITLVWRATLVLNVWIGLITLWEKERNERKKECYLLQTTTLWSVSECNFLEVKVWVIKVHLTDKVCHNFRDLDDKMTRFLIYKTKAACWGLWTMVNGCAELLLALPFHIFLSYIRIYKGTTKMLVLQPSSSELSASFFCFQIAMTSESLWNKNFL